MRTKTLLLTAALGAAGIAYVHAQAVYSVNAVGYVNLTLPGGNFYSLIANPLNGTNNLLTTILPTVPEGSTIQKWDAATQSFTEAQAFYADFGGWVDPSYSPSTVSLNPGEGAFLQVITAGDTTVTFVGEVPQGTLTASVPVNYSVMSQLTPQELGLAAAGFPAGEGDSVLFWDPAVQAYKDALTFYADFGGWVDASYAPANPTPKVGEGFFYLRNSANGATTWTRTFSVSP